MTRNEKRYNRLNECCCNTLAEMFMTEKMQGILGYYEAQTVRQCGIYFMPNVSFSESLGLNVITFKTKKAKKEFFKILFEYWNI